MTEITLECADRPGGACHTRCSNQGRVRWCGDPGLEGEPVYCGLDDCLNVQATQGGDEVTLDTLNQRVERLEGFMETMIGHALTHKEPDQVLADEQPGSQPQSSYFERFWDNAMRNQVFVFDPDDPQPEVGKWFDNVKAIVKTEHGRLTSTIKGFRAELKDEGSLNTEQSELITKLSTEASALRAELKQAGEKIEGLEADLGNSQRHFEEGVQLVEAIEERVSKWREEKDWE